MLIAFIVLGITNRTDDGHARHFRRHHPQHVGIDQVRLHQVEALAAQIRCQPYDATWVQQVFSGEVHHGDALRAQFLGKWRARVVAQADDRHLIAAPGQ